MKVQTTVQADNKSYEITDLETKVKKVLKSEGVKVKDIDSIELYVQPLAGLCYYVAKLNTGITQKGQINL